MSKTNSAIAGAGAGASVGGPVGAAVGGIAGYLMGSDDNSMSYQEELLKKAQNIPLPILKEYYPELYKQVAELNPELETAVDLGPSKMEGIALDPQLRQAQMSALSKLQGIGDAGGRDAQFLSDASRMESDINTNLKGNQDAIIQNLATRGMSGGGSEMVARNMATQNAANRESQQALDLNAQAQQRALQALMQSGQLGGQIQQQDFQQQSTKAQAQDAIAKFNAQNQQQVNQNNVTAKNNAQQFNVTNAQNVNNQNTQGNNQAQLYNNNLGQQDYDNQMKKYGLMTGPSNNLSALAASQARSQDQFAGNAIGAAARGYANFSTGETKDSPKQSWSDNWDFDPNKRQA